MGGVLLGSILLACMVLTGCPQTTDSSGAGLSEEEKTVLAALNLSVTHEIQNGYTEDFSFYYYGKKKGVSLTVASSDPCVKLTEKALSDDESEYEAKITRPDTDTTVTVTLTATKDDITKKKEYTLKLYGKNNEAADKALKAAQAAPLVVDGNSPISAITFNDAASPVEVDFYGTSESIPVTTKWTSSNTAVIANDGTVTRPAAVDKERVSLTAKITAGTVTKEKKFSIVVYKAGTAATAEDVLASITVPSEADIDFNLPTTISGYTAPITWTSGDNKIITIDSGKAVLHRALWEDQTVTLTADLNGKTKDFTLTVKGLTKIENKLEITENTITTKHGKYTYSGHDKSNKTFTATKTHMKDWKTGMLSTLEEVYRKSIEEEKKYLTAYKNLADAIKNKESLTLQDLKGLWNADDYEMLREENYKKIPDDATDEEIFTAINPRFKLAESHDKFDPAKACEVVNKWVDEMCRHMAGNFDCEEGASWNDIINNIDSIGQKFLKEEKKPVVYEYSVDSSEQDSISFSASGQYQTGAAWDKQNGSWHGSVFLQRGFQNNGVLIKDDNDYYGTFTDNFTKFTGTDRDSDTSITATITDNNDKTITVTVDGGETYTLTFHGYEFR